MIQFTKRSNLGLNIRNPNRVSVLFNRISTFWVYQNQPHSGYMKVWFGTGSGSLGFKDPVQPDVLSGSDPNRFFGLKVRNLYLLCNQYNLFFGFKIPDLYLFFNQNINKIDLKIKKEHQTRSFKIKRKVKNININSYW